MAAAVGSQAAIRRLQREMQQLERLANPQLVVRYSEKSMLEWHFVLRNFPPDTVYKDGEYHGKLVFPEQYPHAPPSLSMTTPSGRLEVGRRLCLSMTDFHPESWNPAWTVEALLVGLISFMVEDREHSSIGALNEAPEAQRAHASRSRELNRKDAEFRSLFPELLEAQTPPALAEAPAAEAPEAESSQARPLPGVPPASAAQASDGTAEVPAAEDPQEGVEECWICREDGSAEPLISPCACRGSMTGVHASCVEDWIRHHRSNSLTDEAPKCSVCNQTYCGVESRPGFMSFLGHLLTDLAAQVLRTTVLVGLLIAYWAAAQLEFVPTKVILFVISGGFFLVKTLVLVASLPRGRRPPQSVLRNFYSGEFSKVALHIAEAVAIVCIVTLWILAGQLHYYYVFPVCMILLVPLCTTMLHIRGTEWGRFLWVLLILIATPLLAMYHAAKALYRKPRRLLDPCDGLLHSLVPFTAILLASVYKAHLPLLVLWGSHGVLLLASLADLLTRRKLPWKEGRVWWFYLQMAMLAAYIANLLHNFDGLPSIRGSSVLVFCMSALWLSLSCGIALAVNWNICLRQFRRWQTRNGSFQVTARSVAEVQAQPIGARSGTEVGVLPNDQGAEAVPQVDARREVVEEV